MYSIVKCLNILIDSIKLRILLINFFLFIYLHVMYTVVKQEEHDSRNELAYTACNNARPLVINIAPSTLFN